MDSQPNDLRRELLMDSQQPDQLSVRKRYRNLEKEASESVSQSAPRLRSSRPDSTSEAAQSEGGFRVPGEPASKRPRREQMPPPPMVQAPVQVSFREPPPYNSHSFLLWRCYFRSFVEYATFVVGSRKRCRHRTCRGLLARPPSRAHYRSLCRHPQGLSPRSAQVAASNAKMRTLPNSRLQRRPLRRPKLRRLRRPRLRAVNRSQQTRGTLASSRGCRKCLARAAAVTVVAPTLTPTT